jgi:hypothetical protein
MKNQLITKILLWIGAIFFIGEALLHGFGLKILEHDKIFLATHDRYIALMALTYGVLLILITTDLNKYETLFHLTMYGILIAILIATFITFTGGYSSFLVSNLNSSLRIIGIFAYTWYIGTWISHFKKL